MKYLSASPTLRTLAILGAVFFFGPANAHAQAGWEWQNPKPQGYWLNSIDFRDTLNGWAVGQGGAMLRTTDGGLTWKRRPSPDGTSLRTIRFGDPNHGLLIGDSGLIRYTFDGGETWWTPGTITPHNLHSLTLRGAQFAWTAGDSGTILRTLDGGRTWGVQQSGTTIRLNGISFADRMHGMCVGDSGCVLQTSNGGTTWTRKHSPTTQRLLGVAVLTADVAILVGGACSRRVYEYGGYNDYPCSIIHRTSDAGNTWTMDTVDGPTAYVGFTTIRFDTPDCGWAASNHLIYRTTDQGKTWRGNSNNQLPYGWIDDICFPTRWSGFIVGEGGMLVHTTDSFATWTDRCQTVTGLGSSYNSISFVTGVEGWFAGSSGILYTSDRGEHWKSQWQPSQFGDEMHISGAYFLDRYNGWVYGDGYSVGYGRDYGFILHTSDAGSHWLEPLAPPNDLFPREVFFATPMIGWVVAGSVLYHTSTGGTTWYPRSQAASTFQRVWFVDTLTGWAVCNQHGQIYHTSNGGADWVLQYAWDSTRTGSLNAVKFLDARRGWAAGWTSIKGAPSQAVSYHTSDGGETWVETISDSHPFASAVFSFIDENNWWGCARTTGAFHSTNGGKTWSMVPFPITIYAASFRDSLNGWLLGDNGSILHTYSGGAATVAKPTTEPPPDRIGLYDYPNPSDRHGAVFRVDLPTDTVITIRIINVLGQVVTQLYSGTLDAGVHEFTWDDAAALPGTYICQFITASAVHNVRVVVTR